MALYAKQIQNSSDSCTQLVLQSSCIHLGPYCSHHLLAPTKQKGTPTLQRCLPLRGIYGDVCTV